MADFSIIADTSGALLRLLRENLCPDPVLSPESIALVSPSDKNGDFQLGLYLYDLKELSEFRNTTPSYSDKNIRSMPPKPLSLYYALFINSKAQIAAGAEMEQRIFGRSVQTLADNSALNLAGTNPYLAPWEETTRISLLNLSFEDKAKIWSALQSPYQVGVYFQVSPVLLSSRAEERIARVTSATIDTAIIPHS